MSKKIQILPKEVSQTIAAGEVVERPASVVKELMENAIDAGSSTITVELKSGGLQLVRVCDNGEGIDPDDVPLALQRYATSKLKGTEDLYAIRTLGFRGEALPSIASVSQLVIKTRVGDSISGAKVVCEGGEIKSISEAGGPVGTEVEVKNLFYNIPVKRRFLKSIQTEVRHSLNHFLRLSLSYPSVTFKFIHDGKMIHEFVKTESPLVRMEAILGREIYEHLRPFEFEDREIKISGFGSLPSLSKGNGDGIFIYVNRRYIKDRMVYRAILEAYRHVIPGGKFPVVVLFIDLPPSGVDVNVHPTKAEVKFRDQERIFQAVIGSLRSVHDQGSTATAPAHGGGGAIPSGAEAPLGWRHELPLQKWGGKEKGIEFSDMRPVSLPFKEAYPGSEAKDTPMVKESHGSEWRGEGGLPFRILGQVQGTYILCEGEEGLLFIDQHAAHERLLFEKYKKEYETGSIASERLLIPIAMELSAEESFMMASHLQEFESIGFEIDPLGEKAYALRSVPPFVDQQDSKEVVRKILEELSSIRKEGKGTRAIHSILVTLACHSAIRGNFVLRREEMEGLVQDLHPLHLSATCPHGRPVFFVLPHNELSRQFKRKPSS